MQDRTIQWTRQTHMRIHMTPQRPAAKSSPLFFQQLTFWWFVVNFCSSQKHEETEGCLELMTVSAICTESVIRPSVIQCVWLWWDDNWTHRIIHVIWFFLPILCIHSFLQLIVLSDKVLTLISCKHLVSKCVCYFISTHAAALTIIYNRPNIPNIYDNFGRGPKTGASSTPNILIRPWKQHEQKLEWNRAIKWTVITITKITKGTSNEIATESETAKSLHSNSYGS